MATATSSVGGLVSGLDTKGIITSLMQIEAIPQDRLKSRLSTEKSTVSSLQDLNTMMAAIATKAADLAKALAWSPVTTTVSSDQAVVTAVAGATPTAGSFAFTVGQRAQAHQVAFTDSAALTDVVTAGSTSVRLTRADGTSTDLATGDGTLKGLVSALNGASTGLRASTVKLDDGTYRLRVTSAATGEDAQFTLTNTDGTDLLGGSAVELTGQDAAITIGGDTVHSATNTFTDVVPGLSVSLKSGMASGTAVTVDVATDAAGMTATVKGLVDQLNTALDKLDSLTAYNSVTKTSGALAGDSAARSLRASIVGSIYPSDGTSMAGVGIQVDRYGKLVFDATTFGDAYAADPAAVAAKFTGASTGTPGSTDGFAARVAAVTKSASNSVDGTLTMSITNRNVGIDRLQHSIDDWDVRLALRQDTLSKTYTALETSLSTLKSQGDWLTNQFAVSTKKDS